jgi:toxin-antitoxin system PIN domain toxin
VIVVDANLLIYAHAAALPQHDDARVWLEQQLNGRHRVGLPWASLLAFLRIVTNRRLFDPPAPIDAAWTKVGEWLARDPVWVPTPTRAHADVLGRLLVEQRLSANLVPDAHLAALALEHGLTVASTDGDFARFEGLGWMNPLA